MAITIQQVQTAQSVTLDLLVGVQKLMQFESAVLVLANNNWQSSVTIGGVTKTQTLSTVDQNDILAAYATLKQNLVNTFGQLP